MTGFAALLVVLFAVPAFVAAWAWRGLALRRGWLDLPEARRLHREPTPRGGGVAIVLALVMAMSSLLDLHGTYGAILAGLLITAGAGLLDDLRPLSAPVKLVLQVAGTLPLAWATATPTGPDGSVLGFAAAWGLSLALVNAWNFIDGSNGLAGSQGLLVGVAAIARWYRCSRWPSQTFSPRRRRSASVRPVSSTTADTGSHSSSPGMRSCLSASSPSAATT